MLGTMWLIIKMLAGMIAITILVGILVLLIKSFLEQLFKEEENTKNN